MHRSVFSKPLLVQTKGVHGMVLLSKANLNDKIKEGK